MFVTRLCLPRVPVRRAAGRCLVIPRPVAQRAAYGTANGARPDSLWVGLDVPSIRGATRI